MNNFSKHPLLVSFAGIFLGFMFFCLPGANAQENAIVLVHADKSSGYGVAYGGPQSNPDMIVTALHLVAGKKTINVSWQGKSTLATVEKIYAPSDLALLKLSTPLGIPPLTLYSGETPWDTNINFWEIPIASTSPSRKTTILEERTTLAKISPQLENEPEGLTKALCQDNGQYYPGMSTSVINFKEPNIRKAHSGSPLTYGDKILGMVDGGARLVGGKPCVWAIPAADFNKLFTQGSAPSSSLASCDSPSNANKYMYSGIRSDNPMLTEEEVIQARETDNPFTISAFNGAPLQLHHNYTMDFRDVYETLFDNEKEFLTGVFKEGDSLSLNDLLDMPVSLYVEENTGVSVMVPAQCTFTSTTDEFGTLNTTSSPAGLVQMSFYIAQGQSMEDGMNALVAFKDFARNNDMILESIENPVNALKEGQNYYKDYLKGEFLFKRGGGTKALYMADMTINDGDFLAVVFNAPDVPEIVKTREEKLFLYLMQACTILSDYTIY